MKFKTFQSTAPEETKIQITLKFTIEERSRFISKKNPLSLTLTHTRFSALAGTLFYLPPLFWLTYDPAQNRLFFSLLMIRLEVFRLGYNNQTSLPQTSAGITSFPFLFSIKPQRSFINVMH